MMRKRSFLKFFFSCLLDKLMPADAFCFCCYAERKTVNIVIMATQENMLFNCTATYCRRNYYKNCSRDFGSFKKKSISEKHTVHKCAQDARRNFTHVLNFSFINKVLATTYMRYGIIIQFISK